MSDVAASCHATCAAQDSRWRPRPRQPRIFRIPRLGSAPERLLGGGCATPVVRVSVGDKVDRDAVDRLGEELGAENG
jgi:hypothetical protein